MPKIKSLQEKREDALLGAIGRCRGMLRLNTDRAAAQKIGISPRRYCEGRAKNFQNFRLPEFAKMARALNFTAKDLCDIVGVPYYREDGAQ